MLFITSDPTMTRIVVALCMLATASVLDIKKREINDLLWIGFGGLAFVMFITSGDLWGTAKITGLSMVVVPIALLLWRFGIFGGADALCLIVLAGLAPMATLSDTSITPITTLTNAAIVSVIPLFVNLSRNLFAMYKKRDIFEGLNETRLNKLIAIFVGYRAKNPKFSFSIEKSDGTQKKLNFGFQHAETTQFCSDSETWVTPGIPYILYITAGFIIQILCGDVVVNLIRGV